MSVRIIHLKAVSVLAVLVCGVGLLMADSAPPATRPATTNPSQDAASPTVWTGSGTVRVIGGGTVAAAPWGVPGGGNGSKSKDARFLGIASAGDKVIFLCDASGSMLSVFDSVKRHLKNSVDAMDSAKQFNVIFLEDDKTVVLFKDSTQPATMENKSRATDFIDGAVSSGATEPIAAIKLALEQKPDCVFLLTDGFDEVADPGDVADLFKNSNADGKMKVNCIFLKGNGNPKSEKALLKIAGESNGTFKKMLKSDI